MFLEERVIRRLQGDPAYRVGWGTGSPEGLIAWS
jgi:hypothetical protein